MDTTQTHKWEHHWAVHGTANWHVLADFESKLAYIPTNIFSVIHLQASLLIYLNTREPGGKSINSPRRNCSFLSGLNLQLATRPSLPALFTPSEGSYIMPAASFPGGSSLTVNCRKKRTDFKHIVISVHHNIVSNWTLWFGFSVVLRMFISLICSLRSD